MADLFDTIREVQQKRSDAFKKKRSPQPEPGSGSEDVLSNKNASEKGKLKFDEKSEAEIKIRKLTEALKSFEPVNTGDEEDLEYVKRLETELKLWQRQAEGKSVEGDTDEEKEEYRKHTRTHTPEEIEEMRKHIESMRIGYSKKAHQEGENLEELRKKWDKLKQELKEAREKYENKKEENKKSRSIFQRVLRLKGGAIGQADDEEKALEQIYKDKAEEYEKMEKEMALLENPKADTDEKKKSDGAAVDVIDMKEASPGKFEAEKAEKSPEERAIEKFENQFGIKKEELENIGGFKELSVGQRLLVLENMRQLTLGRIQEASEEKYNQETAAQSGFWRRIWRGFAKNYNIGKVEKETALEMKQGGTAVHGQALSELIKIAEQGPKINVDKDGKLEVAYAGGFSDLNEEEQKILDNFNQVATQYGRMPYDWSVETAEKGERKKFKTTKEEYQKVLSELINLKHQKNGGDGLGASLYINEIEKNIEMNQFLNTSPDVEKAILSIENNRFWNRAGRFALGGISTGEKTFYAGMGAGVRYATVSAIGLWGAPIAAFGMGAFMARGREKKALRKMDVAGRKGAENNEKLGKDFSDAESFSESLEFLVEEIKKESAGTSKREEMIRSLNFNLLEAKRMLDSGTVNFGKKEKQIFNQYNFLQNVSKAEIYLCGENMNLEKDETRFGEDLKTAYDFIRKQDTKLSEDREKHLLKKMLIGAGIGAMCSFAGWLARHYMMGGSINNLRGGKKGIFDKVLSKNKNLPKNSSEYDRGIVPSHGAGIVYNSESHPGGGITQPEDRGSEVKLQTEHSAKGAPALERQGSEVKLQTEYSDGNNDKGGNKYYGDLKKAYDQKPKVDLSQKAPDLQNVDLVKPGTAGLSSEYGEGVAPSHGAVVVPMESHVGVESRNLTIQKGSSFEGTLIKSGIDSGEADRMTHIFAEEKAKALAEKSGKDWSSLTKNMRTRMVNAEMKKLSLVYPGAKLTLSPDGKHIVNFEDSPRGQIYEQKSAKHAYGPRAGHVEKAEAAQVPEETVSSGKKNSSLQENAPGNPASATELKNQLAVHRQINSLNQKISQLDSEITRAGDNKQYDLTMEKQKLEVQRDNLIFGEKVETVKVIRQEIAGGKAEEWNKMQNQPARDILKQKNNPVAVYYNYIIRENPGYARYILPYRYESMRLWTVRLTDYHHQHSGRFANFRIPHRRHW